MDKIIQETLRDLGINPAFRGYRNLGCVIKLALEDEKLIHACTTKLYPRIALIHDVKPANVERTIRHAIEKAWSIPGIELQDVLFKNTSTSLRGNPTNKEFIAIVADYIRTHVEVNNGTE